MKHCLVSRCVALAAVTLTVAACTMKEQEPAPLSGPSEFGQSLNVSVTPDILTQDGASQSVVTVTARGPNGAPLASLPLRAEIVVGGVATDFGKLSARNIATDANGRATVVYTAPASPAGAVVDPFTLVNIAITPLGSDFGNAVLAPDDAAAGAARRRDHRAARRADSELHVHAELADRQPDRAVRRQQQ